MNKSLSIIAVLLVVLAVVMLGQTTPAQSTADQRIQELERRVVALEGQVQNIQEMIRPKMRPAK